MLGPPKTGIPAKVGRFPSLFDANSESAVTFFDCTKSFSILRCARVFSLCEGVQFVSGCSVLCQGVPFVSGCSVLCQGVQFCVRVFRLCQGIQFCVRVFSFVSGCSVCVRVFSFVSGCSVLCQGVQFDQLYTLISPLSIKNCAKNHTNVDL